MEQARRDGVGKVPIVAHKRNFRPWLVTMDAETFFQFLRGVLPPESSEPKTEIQKETQKHENQSE